MAIFPIQPTPMIIPGCVLWMRPDDTSSSNMTVSSNRLSAIKNLANNRILISNGTTANQPSSGLATINGLNAIQFDNDLNRWLTTGLSTTLTNLTIFLVAQKFISNSGGLVLCGPGAEQSIRFAGVVTNILSTDNTTTITATSASSFVTTPSIIGLVCNASTLTRAIYINSTTINATGVYDGTIGTQFFGTNAASSGSARGGYNQGETVIYNRVLTTSEIATIINYLSNKWGIDLT